MLPERLLRFNNLLWAYQKVNRVVYVPGTSAWENDVEHSYQLAMQAWYLIAKDKLKLSVDLVVRYALVHDLVEVYAGDTYFYDAAGRATKHAREAEAARRLAEEFPEFEEMHALIRAYEKQADAESRFVRALDKLQPVLAIFADGGKLWQEKRITLDMLVENKQSIVDRSPEIKPYFDEMVGYLREHPELFTGRKV